MAKLGGAVKKRGRITVEPGVVTQVAAGTIGGRQPGPTKEAAKEIAAREPSKVTPRRTSGEPSQPRLPTQVQPTIARTTTPIGEQQLRTKEVTISGRVVEPVRLRKAIVEEQRRIAPISTITAAPPPRGFLERATRTIRQKQFQLEREAAKRPGVGILGIPWAFAEIGIGGLRFGKELFIRPLPTLKATGVGLFGFGKKLVTGEGFPEVGRMLRQQPGRAIGLIGGELLLFKGTGKVISAGTRVTRVVTTRVSPKFRPIETTPLGEQIITGKPAVGLIPKGRVPKVPVKPLEAVRVAEIPRVAEPVIPRLTPAQRTILGIAKEKGGVVTGSLAEAVLVKPRPFADVDVLLRRPAPAVQEALKRMGLGVKAKKVTIKTPTGKIDISRIVTRRKGKVIADIDPLLKGEEGFALKFPTVTVEGVKFVSPEARLAAKVTQFGRGKRSAKVLRDIERLSGGKLKAIPAAKSPLVKGAFGFTKAEQARFIGKKGVVVTSARGLFKPFKPTVKIEEPLFFTPPDPITGLAQTRVSRLAIEGTKEATILDMLAGDITFRRPKPQIVLVPEITVGKEVKPFGLPGAISPELEVVRLGGKIKKIKTVGVTLIEGERVPIITAKFIKGKKLPKGLIGKETKPPKQISKAVKVKPFISPTGVSTKGLLAAGKPPSVAPKITPRVKISVPPSARVRLKPSKIPSIIPIIRVPGRQPSRPPIKIPSKIPSLPPSKLPSLPPSIPPSLPPSIPPSIPLSRPPSLPPSRPPIIPPKVPTPPPPRLIPFRLPKKFRILKPKKKKRKALRPTRFQPSLSAVIPGEEIFGRKPELLTGIKTRPIPVERMLRGKF